MAGVNRRTRVGQRHAGQAMLESLVVLLVLLAGFFFFYDFSYGVVTRLLLNHATARVARADAVGFNEFHRAKTLRVGLIPVSGRRTVPDGDRVVAGAAGELALVRTFLQSEDWADANGILVYDRWSRLTHRVRRRNDLCEVTTSFSVPEQMPWKLGRLFGVARVSAEDEEDEPTCPYVAGWQEVRAQWAIEDHASYYLRR